MWCVCRFYIDNTHRFAFTFFHPLFVCISTKCNRGKQIVNPKMRVRVKMELVMRERKRVRVTWINHTCPFIFHRFASAFRAARPNQLSGENLKNYRCLHVDWLPFKLISSHHVCRLYTYRGRTRKPPQRHTAARAIHWHIIAEAYCSKQLNQYIIHNVHDAFNRNQSDYFISKLIATTYGSLRCCFLLLFRRLSSIHSFDVNSRPREPTDKLFIWRKLMMTDIRNGNCFCALTLALAAGLTISKTCA